MILGIDIGGTTIKFGLFKPSGALDKKWEIPTRTDYDGMFIINDIEAAIGDHIEIHKLRGIGFAAPGPVDGTLISEAVNLGWKNVDLKDAFQKKFGPIPISVDNDANAAALGEAMSRPDPYQSMIFITLGTGVGGGVIINQSIVEGAHGVGGEIGHMKVVDNGIKCNCGNTGCLETVASATGIVRVAKERYKTPTNLIKDDLTAKQIFDLAKDGDAFALDVVGYVTDVLAQAMQAMAVIIDPDAFVIGGGVAKAGTFLTDMLQEKFAKMAFAGTKHIPVELAILGNNAGIYGAYHSVKKEVDA